MDIIEYKHSSLAAKISVLSTLFLLLFSSFLKNCSHAVREHFNISNFTYNCRNPLKVIKVFLKFNMFTNMVVI